MVSQSGLKWSIVIASLAAAACCVAVGLPMWAETNYTGASSPIYLRYGLWQICTSINSGTLSCSEYGSSSSSTTEMARYLGTAGAVCFVAATVILVMYACQCAKHTCLPASAMLLLMAGLGLGGAAAGLFYDSNLTGSTTIGVGGIVEFVGLGLGFVALLVVLGAIFQKDEPPEIMPMPYVRNERRVIPLKYDDPGTEMPARDEAKYYLEKYRKLRDDYDDTNGQFPNYDPNRIQRYEDYYRQMGGRF